MYMYMCICIYISAVKRLIIKLIKLNFFSELWDKLRIARSLVGEKAELWNINLQLWEKNLNCEMKKFFYSVVEKQ